MTARLLSTTPLIPGGADFDAELRFYVERMGFRIQWQGDGIAGIERDGVAFNLQRNDDRAWAENSSYSIGVRDLEALYAEYRELPVRVGALETKAWGRREFHLIVPSGVCFQFYEAA
jgi:hypothetical protein